MNFTDGILKKKVVYLVLFSSILVGIGLVTLPDPQSEYAKILFSSDGQLLGARVANDQQWRFKPLDTLPFKYKKALVTFEDNYFYFHFGVNPVSICKALLINLKSGSIKTGGSTISMQNIRLRRGFDKKRNISNKLIEIYWALILELKYSKDRILTDYASRAPFGANVIGFESACWRYFEKPSELVTWAEASLLAVLPNSPSLMHPGKNRGQLEIKRNALLIKLLSKNIIDSATYHLSLLEEIPSAPKTLPSTAPHALNHLIQAHPQQSDFFSTIQYSLQHQLNELASWYYTALANNRIHNIGIVVAETESGNVLAYIGNAPNTIESKDVDHIQAQRSTGSILKPFLYMGAQYRGTILPGTLLFDIPSVIDGYQPKNFSLQHQGAVQADDALIQSLNIPFVLLLKEYGLEQFHFDLRKLGIRGISKPASHYGLSLILGGAEASLWDITGAYASLGRSLLHFNSNDHSYVNSDIRPFNLIKAKYAGKAQISNVPVVFSNASIYNAFRVMQDVRRPDELGNWDSFASQMPLAWKTGTSFGFRDAWAIGVNAKYTIGVWVGNSSGEGRPGLLGIKAAAPILFDIASKLSDKSNTVFAPPLDELIEIPVCSTSGMKPSDYCESIDTLTVCRHQNISMPCNFHRQILINSKGNLVNQSCVSTGTSKKNNFTLPPLAEYYYSPMHAEYEKMPLPDPSCIGTSNQSMMNMISPENNSALYIPKDINGLPGKVVFRLAHRRPETPVHWHLDDNYYTTTRTFHEVSFNTSPGDHTMTIVDSFANEIKLQFTVLSK